MTVKWNRSEDGYVTSKCGRFHIDPLFMGCTTAQAYHLNGVGYYNTQREAKVAAESLVASIGRTDHEEQGSK